MTLLDSFRLDGKVVVVTGASSGLGVAFAKGFAEAGADLMLGARAGWTRWPTPPHWSSRLCAVTHKTDVADPISASSWWTPRWPSSAGSTC